MLFVLLDLLYLKKGDQCGGSLIAVEANDKAKCALSRVGHRGSLGYPRNDRYPYHTSSLQEVRLVYP